jgi:FixJ family two-component response regulator
MLEDDVMVARALRSVLEQVGYGCVMCHRLGDALELLDRTEHDHGLSAAVLDLHLPDGDGASLLPRLDLLYPLVPAVVVSGLVTCEYTRNLRAGTFVMSKPVDPEQFRCAINRVCTTFADAHDLTRAESEVTDLVVLAMSNAKMGGALGVATRTVRELLARAFARTQAQNKVELVSMRIEHDARHGRTNPSLSDCLRRHYGLPREPDLG